MASKKDQIVQLLSTSWLSQNEIARQVGCKQPYVQAVLNDLGGSQVALSSKIEAFRIRCIEMLVDKIEKFNLGDKSSDFFAQLKGMERLAKMVGFDQPEKVDIRAQVHSININFNIPKPNANKS